MKYCCHFRRLEPERGWTEFKTTSIMPLNRARASREAIDELTGRSRERAGVGVRRPTLPADELREALRARRRRAVREAQRL